MIEVLERQRSLFRLRVIGIDCTYKPVELWKGKDMMPLAKKAKGTTVGWNIRGFVSVFQIHHAIKEAYTAKNTPQEPTA